MTLAAGLVLAIYFAGGPLDGVLDTYGLGGLGPAIAAAMLGILAVAGVASRISRRVLIVLPFLLLLWWSAATTIWSDTAGAGLRSVALQAYLMLPMFFAFACPLDGRWRRVCQWSLSVAVCLAVSYGAYSLLTLTTSRWAGRLSVSDDYNPTWLAAYAGLAVLLSVSSLTHSTRPRLRVMWGLAGALSFMGVLATQGRNALISLTATLAIVYGHRLQVKILGFLRGDGATRRGVRRAAIGVSISLVLLGLATVGFINLVSRYPDLISFERITLLFSGDSNLATAGRTVIWTDYASAIASGDFWLLGAGAWSATEAGPDHMGITVPPHNAFLSVLVELGLPGLILYLLGFVTFARIALATAGPHRLACQSTLAYAFLLGFGNDVLTYKYFWAGLTMFAVLSVQSTPRLEASTAKLRSSRNQAAYGT